MDEGVKIERIAELEKMDSYYANSSMITHSNWDFQLMFGKFRLKEERHVVETYEKIIYMSPQQAKAFLNALSENVSKYEKNFGEIVLSPKGKG